MYASCGISNRGSPLICPKILQILVLDTAPQKGYTPQISRFTHPSLACDLGGVRYCLGVFARLPAQGKREKQLEGVLGFPYGCYIKVFLTGAIFGFLLGELQPSGAPVCAVPFATRFRF